jgi:capsid assembly protease
MRNLPMIAGALYCEPWMVRPEVHAQFSSQFRSLIDGKMNLTELRQEDVQGADDPAGPYRVNEFTGQKIYYQPQVEKANGVALLNVEGVIGKHLSLFEMSCYGGADLAIFEQQMANVRDDEDIHTLVLNFNTPGGRAQGVERAAQSIRAVSAAGKRTVGFTDTCCASAGYFMAAACDEFYAENDAIVGSISTICAGIDDSRMWEMEGLKLELFATGSLKAVGHPGKPWTEEERQFMRDRAAVVDNVFKGFCRERRGLSDEAMNGAHWYARNAPAGIIDGHVGTIREMIEAVMK